MPPQTQQQNQQQNTNTVVITNFGGRLTRILNGDMNSGFAKFNTSWGYDPFSKPQNLTWLEQPTDITGPITNLPLAAKVTQNQATVANATVFLYDAGKKLYGIQPNSISTPNVDSVVGIGSVSAGMGSLSRSASMEFFGNTLQVYIGTEYGVNKANFDGSSDAQVLGPGGATARYAANVYRPLKQFIGKLFFGNAHTIGSIDNTGTATSTVASVYGSNLYSDLNPTLPVESQVQDLDVTLDGNYLLITGANTTPERIDTVSNDLPDSIANESALYKWNGTDAAVTSFTSLPSYSASALQTYLGSNLFFSNDIFGSSISDENQKILTLPNNKSPLPNATCTNGNFLTWWCPEVDSAGTTRYASLYYFGSLDEENPIGLYRLLRWTTTQSSAQVFQAPLNLMIGNHYQTLTSSYAVTTYSYGKHYLGVGSVNTSGTYQNFLLRFLVTPTGTGTPNLGVYETQTQLFSKKVVAKQIRVYTEPTAANNGFQIDLIGSDGSVLTNGTFTYTFSAGSDPTTLTGSLQRIDYNFTAAPTYAMGVRITNTGTANMTIKKIELDIVEIGK